MMGPFIDLIGKNMSGPNKTRDFNDPKYKACRRAAKSRDKFKCVLCGSKRRLQVHHIKRWADYPELRYELSNLVTLCYQCHKKMWNKEEEYAGILSNAICPTRAKINKLLDEYGI